MFKRFSVRVSENSGLFRAQVLHWHYPLLQVSLVRLILFLWLILLLPASSLSLAGENVADELTAEERHWLAEGHTVRARVANFPPYQMREPYPQGLSLDLLDYFAKTYGFKVEYVPESTWPQALADLAGPREKIDMVLTMNRTAERERQFALTDDYLTMPWVIYQRQNSPFISSVDNLKDKVVSIEKGYVIYQLLKKDRPDIRFMEVNSSEQALRAVATGQADAYVGNLAVATYIISRNGLNNLVVAAPTHYGDHTQAMAIRNDWKPLASIINRGIRQMPQEVRERLTQKWTQIEVRSQIDYSLVWQVLAISLFILISFLFWNRKLSFEVRLRKASEQALDNQNRVLESIEYLQGQYIKTNDPFMLYPAFLDKLLEISRSQYGLVGEVLHENGKPFLKSYALSNLAWNEETRKLYEETKDKGFEFRKLDNLFGIAITSGEVIFSNDPAADPRRAGLPPGHPPLNSFIGIPIFHGDRIVGEVGLANREEGYDDTFLAELMPVFTVLGQVISGRLDREARRKAEQELERLAITDPLTGVANRRHFESEIKAFFDRAVRFKESLAIVMLDIDHFKRINDAHGHEVGDQVLVQMVKLIHAEARTVDLFARWGGEEFMLIMPHTHLEAAGVFAERIRSRIAEHDFEISQPVTISIGISSKQPDDSIRLMLKRADQALYRAKHNGRNRVELENLT